MWFVTHSLRMRYSVTFAVALLLALASPPTAVAADPCSGDPGAVQSLTLTVGGQPATGIYTLPSGPPRGMVVFGHGAANTVDAWRKHLPLVSRREGVISVAMNYRGMQVTGRSPERGTETARGWPAKAGAEDLVAAAQHFDRRCRGLGGIVMYGVSMGGNMTGLGVAAGAKRVDGRPLFDYWVAVEGVHNLVETYNEARLVSPAVEFAATTVQDIEAETGGPFETASPAYLERTNLNRVEDIAASGVRGVILVHAYEDGTVPYNQSAEMTQRLREAGVPTDHFSVGGRGEGEAGTTIGSYGGGDTGNAGHGWEGSDTHVVIQSGLDRLNALITRGEPAPCNRDFRIDDTPQNVSPPPQQAPAGCEPDPLPPASAGACEDREAPAPVAVRVARRRGRTVLSGRAADRGCGRVTRVRVAVAKRAGGRCRFMLRGGRLGRARACRRKQFVRASGREQWRLRLPARLPRGSYATWALAVDQDGRRGPLGAPRRFRVR